MKNVIRRLLFAVLTMEAAGLVGAGAYAAGYVHGMWDTERATRTVLATTCKGSPLKPEPAQVQPPPTDDRIWL